ncbi:hypothetical protein B0F90DRAFT_1763485 [Multifurca ochricompacta]|uniref:Uncharacterized protein n=1 Tax=Multifurca ochricompacta TaxID=376703 RepID=A0AAD4LWV3_9AGAM|nr:hypothetical protein B0F90DRAFT_1763485 [Multifurca ochricompacta]
MPPTSARISPLPPDFAPARPPLRQLPLTSSIAPYVLSRVLRGASHTGLLPASHGRRSTTHLVTWQPPWASSRRPARRFGRPRYHDLWSRDRPCGEPGYFYGGEFSLFSSVVPTGPFGGPKKAPSPYHLFALSLRGFHMGVLSPINVTIMNSSYYVLCSSRAT